MKTTIRTFRTTIRRITPIITLALLEALTAASVLAQTIVSGPVSGTWSLGGSPYVLVDNCTVPAGQTLRINPGVSLIIGADLSLTASGTIQALGSADQRIQIAGASPSAPYSNIIQLLSSPSDSRFEYCDFRYAKRALWFEADGAGTNFNPMVLSCTFSNISQIGVTAKSVGRVHTGLDGNYPLHSYVDPLIRNCIFSSCGKGCSTWTFGTYYWQPFLEIVGSGYASSHIENNLFYDITNVAVEFYSTTYAGVSTPLVANNTMVGCYYGVVAYDPNDATIKNNIFATNTYSVWRNGARSGTVGFNCFYQNATNFWNYPSAYGQIVWQNPNGTPSDVAYNIFLNPLWASDGLFQLQPTSPCIDAGDPSGAYLDNCTNSLGTTVNDIGLYGGPGACGWLASTNTTFTLNAGRFVGVTINPSMPGRYRLEYRAQVDTGMWTQLTNVNLLSTPLIYIDYDYPGPNKRFYRAVLLQ